MDFSKKFEINSARLNLYQQLFIYGDFIPLRFKINCEKLDEELIEFRDKWVPYNISRGDTGRVGLSLTSLDGGMSGYPDLQSLYQYSKETGVKVSENQFDQLTDLYKKCFALKEVVDYFSPHLGRSRLVKFKPGGFFPPHRDQSVSFQVPDYFRLFAALSNTERDGLFFIYDDKKIPVEPGRVYLFNALKVHSVFSFRKDALTLAISLKLNQESVERAIHSFETK